MVPQKVHGRLDIALKGAHQNSPYETIKNMQGGDKKHAFDVVLDCALEGELRSRIDTSRFT